MEIIKPLGDGRKWERLDRGMDSKIHKIFFRSPINKLINEIRSFCKIWGYSPIKMAEIGVLRPFHRTNWITECFMWKFHMRLMFFIFILLLIFAFFFKVKRKILNAKSWTCPISKKHLAFHEIWMPVQFILQALNPWAKLESELSTQNLGGVTSERRRKNGFYEREAKVFWNHRKAFINIYCTENKNTNSSTQHYIEHFESYNGIILITAKIWAWILPINSPKVRAPGFQDSASSTVRPFDRSSSFYFVFYVFCNF